jgi:glycosyltransferase involved in cell wall biosynthesis
MRPRALVVLPEAAYPVMGGGPLRTASILEWLRERYELSAIHFVLEGEADPLRGYPEGMFGEALRLELPRHDKGIGAKVRRNLLRAARGVTPLVDRFGGRDGEIGEWLAGRRYEMVWVEHFWAAQYGRVLRRAGERLVLDLHNVESAYFGTLARTATPTMLWRHFAWCAAREEARWLGDFDRLVVSSEADAGRVKGRRVSVVPNTAPWREKPEVGREKAVVFSGNFAYAPNQQGLKWFLGEVWPRVIEQEPELRLRLVGKEVECAPGGGRNVERVGAVEDAVAEIARARVAVVPIRSGSGTRLKILEAFAAGVPVVSTGLGAEGLRLRGEVVLADEGRAFAEAIVGLVRDEGRQRALGEAGRRLYEAEYNWRSAWKALDLLDL